MVMEVSFEGTENEKDLESGGNTVQKPGWYHVHCVGVTPVKEDNKLPHLKFEFQVLDGEEADQVGKTVYYRLMTKQWQEGSKKTVMVDLEERGMNAIRKVAIGLGLVGKWAFGQSGVKIPWHLSEARQCVLEIRKDRDWTDDKGQKRTGGHSVAFHNIYRLDTEEAKKTKLSPEGLDMLGMNVEEFYKSIDSPEAVGAGSVQDEYGDI